MDGTNVWATRVRQLKRKAPVQPCCAFFDASVDARQTERQRGGKLGRGKANGVASLLTDRNPRRGDGQALAFWRTGSEDLQTRRSSFNDLALIILCCIRIDDGLTMRHSLPIVPQRSMRGMYTKIPTLGIAERGLGCFATTKTSNHRTTPAR